MKILLTTLEGNIYPVEVSSDIEVVNLKALCEQETNIVASKMSLTHNGQPLSDDSRSLSSYNVKEDDILMIQQIVGNNPAVNVPLIDFSSISVPQSRPRSSNSTSGTSSSAANMSNMRRLLMSDPAQFEMIRQRYPDLADAIQKNDSVKMLQLFNQIQSGLTGSGGSGGDSLLQASNYSDDYMDLEAQKKIAENIRLQNIQQNMESALEYMPEAFGNVVMLYIDCQVNGHHVKAFVDSGAQMTIMSSACAERCGIMRLVDVRWAGIAKGVGTQKIVGRVHLAQIQIEKSFLTTAFSILEEQPMDMLLGLDILKRHQCVIDLQRSVLIFKSANIETKFLPESDLPMFARLNHGGEEMDVGTDSKATPRQEKQAAKRSSSTSPSRQAGSDKSYPEAVINNLLKLGATRADVLEALNTSNGDENSAKIKLLARMLQSPKK